MPLLLTANGVTVPAGVMVMTLLAVEIAHTPSPNPTGDPTVADAGAVGELVVGLGLAHGDLDFGARLRWDTDSSGNAVIRMGVGELQRTGAWYSSGAWLSDTRGPRMSTSVVRAASAGPTQQDIPGWWTGRPTPGPYPLWIGPAWLKLYEDRGDLVAEFWEGQTPAEGLDPVAALLWAMEFSGSPAMSARASVDMGDGTYYAGFAGRGAIGSPGEQLGGASFYVGEWSYVQSGASEQPKPPPYPFTTQAGDIAVGPGSRGTLALG